MFVRAVFAFDSIRGPSEPPVDFILAPPAAPGGGG